MRSPQQILLHVCLIFPFELFPSLTTTCLNIRGTPEFGRFSGLSWKLQVEQVELTTVDVDCFNASVTCKPPSLPQAALCESCELKQILCYKTFPTLWCTDNMVELLWGHDSPHPMSYSAQIFAMSEAAWFTTDVSTAVYLPFAVRYREPGISTYKPIWIWRHHVGPGAIIRRNPGTRCTYYDARPIVAVTQDWDTIYPVHHGKLVRVLKQLRCDDDNLIRGYFVLYSYTERQWRTTFNVWPQPRSFYIHV